jgi:hypothetical protein
VVVGVDWGFGEEAVLLLPLLVPLLLRLLLPL